MVWMRVGFGPEINSGGAMLAGLYNSDVIPPTVPVVVRRLTV